jgi:hypothetical protein
VSPLEQSRPWFTHGTSLTEPTAGFATLPFGLSLHHSLFGLERLGSPRLHHQGCHRDWLAAKGLWLFMELEDSPRQARPRQVPKDVRELIRMLSRENPLRDAPHIRGELMKPASYQNLKKVAEFRPIL